MQILYKCGLALAAVALVIGMGVSLVKIGHLRGATEIQEKWDKDVLAREKAMSKLQGEYNVLQDQHTTKVQELDYELQASSAKHEATLAGYKSDYDKRLQLANGRAGTYQRQAQGTAVERDSLAKHAAELDRSLEQGRSLVRELRETVGQRDATIQSLGKLIKADRALFNGEPNGY